MAGREQRSGSVAVWFFDYSGHSTGWTFGSNLYWDAGRGMAVITSDSARIAADPKFTNASLSDLSIRVGSPAIDKATQTVSFGLPDDFMQIARPKGALNDIGAFEFAS